MSRFDFFIKDIKDLEHLKDEERLSDVEHLFHLDDLKDEEHQIDTLYSNSTNKIKEHQILHLLSFQSFFFLCRLSGNVAFSSSST